MTPRRQKERSPSHQAKVYAFGHFKVEALKDGGDGIRIICGIAEVISVSILAIANDKSDALLLHL